MIRILGEHENEGKILLVVTMSFPRHTKDVLEGEGYEVSLQ